MHLEVTVSQMSNKGKCRELGKKNTSAKSLTVFNLTFELGQLKSLTNTHLPPNECYQQASI